MIVITAASGKLGQAVTESLENRVPLPSVRLAVRSPEKVQALQTQGFQVVQADYDNPSSMEAAFVGADKVLLISGDGPSDVRIHQHKDTIDAAGRAGVRHIVYTSFTNPTAESRFVWARVHMATEEHLKKSGIAYTILRNNQYASNLDTLLSQAMESGIFALPGASGKVAYLTHRDIAMAVASVLTGSGHEGKCYELTGPEALDGQEIAAALSGTLGREVKSIDAAYDDFAAYFRTVGYPEFAVEGLISIYQAAAAGEYSMVSRDIDTLTGRPGTSIRTYIKVFAGA